MVRVISCAFVDHPSFVFSGIIQLKCSEYDYNKSVNWLPQVIYQRTSINNKALALEPKKFKAFESAYFDFGLTKS